ncbi:unnamed protein product [Sphenostylis stenocarpa]|uniref:Uncharacterized protein n=1 Tax=Sphenostylis stenocarpa TaxID=92480 RepID=A0AA86S7C2_9FABA|nr:unnamed protein product [Sphenostylis stenocarpa]
MKDKPRKYLMFLFQNRNTESSETPVTTFRVVIEGSVRWGTCLFCEKEMKE